IGAFLGPTLCGLIGENYNWHWGFSLAGFGMVLGLIQYKLGEGYLRGAGELKTDETPEARSRLARKFYLILAGVVGIIVLAVLLARAGIIGITLTSFAEGLGYSIIALAIFYFVYLIGFAG